MLFYWPFKKKKKCECENIASKKRIQIGKYYELKKTNYRNGKNHLSVYLLDKCEICEKTYPLLISKESFSVMLPEEQKRQDIAIKKLEENGYENETVAMVKLMREGLI